MGNEHSPTQDPSCGMHFLLIREEDNNQKFKQKMKTLLYEVTTKSLEHALMTA